MLAYKANNELLTKRVDHHPRTPVRLSHFTNNLPAYALRQRVPGAHWIDQGDRPSRLDGAAFHCKPFHHRVRHIHMQITERSIRAEDTSRLLAGDHYVHVERWVFRAPLTSPVTKVGVVVMSAHRHRNDVGGVNRGAQQFECRMVFEAPDGCGEDAAGACDAPSGLDAKTLGNDLGCHECRRRHACSPGLRAVWTPRGDRSRSSDITVTSIDPRLGLQPGTLGHVSHK